MLFEGETGRGALWRGFVLICRVAREAALIEWRETNGTQELRNFLEVGKRTSSPNRKC